jgi:microcystin-dependent protein
MGSWKIPTSAKGVSWKSGSNAGKTVHGKGFQFHSFSLNPAMASKQTQPNDNEFSTGVTIAVSYTSSGSDPTQPSETVQGLILIPVSIKASDQGVSETGTITEFVAFPNTNRTFRGPMVIEWGNVAHDPMYLFCLVRGRKPYRLVTFKVSSGGSITKNLTKVSDAGFPVSNVSAFTWAQNGNRLFLQTTKHSIHVYKCKQAYVTNGNGDTMQHMRTISVPNNVAFHSLHYLDTLRAVAGPSVASDADLLQINDVAPNLSGRIPRGVSSSDNVVVGSVGGVGDVTLTVDNIPAHHHHQENMLWEIHKDGDATHAQKKTGHGKNDAHPAKYCCRYSKMKEGTTTDPIDNWCPHTIVSYYLKTSIGGSNHDTPTKTLETLCEDVSAPVGSLTMYVHDQDPTATSNWSRFDNNNNNWQGRVPVGASPKTLDQTGGSAKISLDKSQIPDHKHTFHKITVNFLHGGHFQSCVRAHPNSSRGLEIKSWDTGTTGQGKPRFNVPPYYGVKLIHKTQGQRRVTKPLPWGTYMFYTPNGISAASTDDMFGSSWTIDNGPFCVGRSPRGWGEASKHLLEKGGKENVVLLQNQLPEHQHALNFLNGVQDGACCQHNNDYHDKCDAPIGKDKVEFHNAPGCCGKDGCEAKKEDRTSNGVSSRKHRFTSPHSNMPPYRTVYWIRNDGSPFAFRAHTPRFVLHLDQQVPTPYAQNVSVVNGCKNVQVGIRCLLPSGAQSDPKSFLRTHDGVLLSLGTPTTQTNTKTKASVQLVVRQGGLYVRNPHTQSSALLLSGESLAKGVSVAHLGTESLVQPNVCSVRFRLDTSDQHKVLVDGLWHNQSFHATVDVSSSVTGIGDGQLYLGDANSQDTFPFVCTSVIAIGPSSDNSSQQQKIYEWGPKRLNMRSSPGQHQTKFYTWDSHGHKCALQIPSACLETKSTFSNHQQLTVAKALAASMGNAQTQQQPVGTDLLESWYSENPMYSEHVDKDRRYTQVFSSSRVRPQFNPKDVPPQACLVTTGGDTTGCASDAPFTLGRVQYPVVDPSVEIHKLVQKHRIYDPFITQNRIPQKRSLADTPSSADLNMERISALYYNGVVGQSSATARQRAHNSIIPWTHPNDASVSSGQVKTKEPFVALLAYRGYGSRNKKTSTVRYFHPRMTQTHTVS